MRKDLLPRDRPCSLYLCASDLLTKVERAKFDLLSQPLFFHCRDVHSKTYVCGMNSLCRSSVLRFAKRDPTTWRWVANQKAGRFRWSDRSL